MRNLMGERAALEQTKKIVAGMGKGFGLTKKLQRQIVSQIYDNQLKKYTQYNRSTRHQMIKELFKGKHVK